MKKTFSIPYGRGVQAVQVEESLVKAVLVPAGEQACAPTLEQERLTALEALLHPIGSPRLCELAAGKKRILVITSDHTRPVPSQITMPLLLAELREGSPQADIRILLATGMHRPSTPQEILNRFGEEIVQTETILNHFAGRDEEMVFKGILPSGGELWLNGLVDWAELILAEGFIEPHFFAGFSGGRKSILPGIASRKTVLYNHNSGFIAHPAAVQGSLEGNPLHKDMCFAAQAAPLSFILNVRLDGEKKIIAAYAGDPVEAHAQGCADCLAHSSVSKAEGDIVITSNGGYPLDQNIYQAVKGMRTGAACVKPKGVIIMAAACENGHGGEDFYNWFASAQNPAEVAARIAAIPAASTLPDQWEAQVLAENLLKARCIFVTLPENEALIRGMHMTYAASLQSALDLACEWAGPSAKVVIIPDGPGTIVR